MDISVKELAEKLEISTNSLRAKASNEGWKIPINGGKVRQNTLIKILTEYSQPKQNRPVKVRESAKALLKSAVDAANGINEKQTIDNIKQWSFNLKIQFAAMNFLLLFAMIYQVKHMAELLGSLHKTDGLLVYMLAISTQAAGIFLTVSENKNEKNRSKWFQNRYLLIFAVVEFLINIFLLKPWEHDNLSDQFALYFVSLIPSFVIYTYNENYKRFFIQ